MDLLTVRRAEAKDVEAIASIISDAWRQTYKNILPQSYIEEVIADYYSLDRVAKECAENTPYFHGYWVAVKDGQVLGCIGGGIDQENAGHIYFLCSTRTQASRCGDCSLKGLYGLPEK